MDRSWVKLKRSSDTYMEGLNRFLDVAFESECSRNGAIRCPCKKCYNMTWQNRAQVFEHIIINGWDKRYLEGPWIEHGEDYRTFYSISPSASHSPEQSVIHDLLNDLLQPRILDNEVEMSSNSPPADRVDDPTPNEAAQFYGLLAEADKDLYPGCTTYKKLEFLINLYQQKVLSGWSDRSFSHLLNFLKSSYPEGETLPKNFYELKKLIGKFGLSYDKIHACPNDCMLYWRDTVNMNHCSHCGKSRWVNEHKKIPAKVFRYFPLTPRLKRLYMSRHIAYHMRWHDVLRTKDGVLRHPADSLAWKNLDERYPDFAVESRNVRLGLASDGFNPFGNMSTSHSTWPILLIIYNLPPWMCMKQPYILMSSIIAGPKGPGIDIDVYLQPLIYELKELWDTGVRVYDAFTNETFMMRAALMWTINDFPAYAILSGWSTKGRYACPNCGFKTSSKWLVKGRKFCYTSHRTFLSQNHRYRRQKSEKLFSGKEELRPTPKNVCGVTCLEQLEGMTFPIGKGLRSTKIRKKDRQQWKKKSIFFELPYWEHHLIRHNLDVMHIEKNVCDSIVGTLLDIKGKTKDGLKAREDLSLMKIKSHLHPIIVNGKKVLPPASFTLSPRQKKLFCSVLANVKVPDGYASNLARCVDPINGKLTGWKSHDCHIVMQQLLPLAMLNVLPKHVMKTLTEFSSFFEKLCSKTSTYEDFDRLSSTISLILCEMEKIFPPSFFDVMVHLPVHLAYEASLAGPVHYRWMYPIERYLHTLKGYVRNKSRPEGSIAEGYIVEECMSFCSNYLKTIDSRHTRHGRNSCNSGRSVDDGLPIFSTSGRALGQVEHVRFETTLWVKARLYVLFNCPEVKPYLDEHFVYLQNKYPGERQLKWAWQRISDRIAWTEEQSIVLQTKVMEKCFQKASAAWKEKKGKLRQKYNTDKNDPTRWIPPHVDIDEEQWKNLVLHWDDPHYKEKQIVNQRNRSQQEFQHCTGSKPHAVIVHEYLCKHGKLPDMVTLYLLCHTKGQDENTWVDEGSKQKWEQIQATLTEMPLEIQNTTEGRNAAWEKVFADSKIGCGVSAVDKPIRKKSKSAIDMALAKMYVELEAQFEARLNASKRVIEDHFEEKYRKLEMERKEWESQQVIQQQKWMDEGARQYEIELDRSTRHLRPAGLDTPSCVYEDSEYLNEMYNPLSQIRRLNESSRRYAPQKELRYNSFNPSHHISQSLPPLGDNHGWRQPRANLNGAISSSDQSSIPSVHASIGLADSNITSTLSPVHDDFLDALKSYRPCMDLINQVREGKQLSTRDAPSNHK